MNLAKTFHNYNYKYSETSEDLLGCYNEITCILSTYPIRMHAGGWVYSLSHYYNFKVVLIIILSVITIINFVYISVAVD